MLDKVKALEDLQKIDVQILELERGGAEHPKKLAEIEAQLEATRSIVDAERAKLADVEKQKKTAEEELAAAKDRVKKWEARLTEQRTTREYSALAREVDIAKKQNVTLQETIAELAQQAEAARAAVDDKERLHKDKADALIARAAEIKKAIDELSGRRAALEEKRAEAAKKADAVLLRKYETIRKRKGTAIAPIVGGACKGCNMNIPPQLYNELRTHPRLDQCPSCGRIIYSVEAFGGEKPTHP